MYEIDESKRADGGGRMVTIRRQLMKSQMGVLDRDDTPEGYIARVGG